MKQYPIILIVFLFGYKSLLSQHYIDPIRDIKLEEKAICPQNQKPKKYFPKVIPTYFVLGTLSDYMGRFAYVKRNLQVDKYYPHEKPLVDYLIEYIKQELNIKVDTTFKDSRHCEMYSGNLSKILNAFYGEKDELIDSMFLTNEQIYSFLTGVYYRYGDKLDTSIYKIQLANSPKHKNCYDFLKKVGCNKIFYKYLKNIPAQFILYFEPTAKLETHFNNIEKHRLILKESFYDESYELLKEHIEEKELEQIFLKGRNEEILNIKHAFK